MNDHGSTDTTGPGRELSPGRVLRGAVLAASILAAGCGQAPGESDPAGAGDGRVEEATQGLESSQACVSIRRQGAAGAVVDTQIVNKAPPKSYGASQTMNTGSWSGAERQTLIRFDLSAIPPGPGTNIKTANVSLSRGPLAPIGTGGVVDVHEVTAPWSELDVTWQSFAGAYDPSVLASFSSAGTTHGFDLRPLVTSWVRGAEPNHGILLREAGATASNFWSSEHTDPPARPALAVCYTVTCDPGFADCNADAADGCETNTTSSVASCGACGQACSVQNGTPACVAGTCRVASCAAGFADCDGNAANGCEGTVCSDGAHCSSNTDCLSGVCTAGICAPSTTSLTIASNTSHYNLAAVLGQPASPVSVVVTILPNVVVSSNFTSLPALTTGALPSGSVVKIVNRGYIIGRGGNGSVGTMCANNVPGGDGGAALETMLAISIDNTQGNIWGGGGGGSGSAGNCSTHYGGSGGGGAGGGLGATVAGFTSMPGTTGPNGIGGQGSYGSWGGGLGYNTSGGNGGSYGQPGMQGWVYSGAWLNKPGGAAGQAVKRSNGATVTWLGGSGNAAPRVLGPQ